MAETASSASPVSCFLREKQFTEESIHKIIHRCARLKEEGAEMRARENWRILCDTVGIPQRKLPSIASKCPHLLAISNLHQKLHCLAAGLGAEPKEVAAAITRFPRLLLCSLEEKICPLLAFLETIGVPRPRLSKVLLACPRLISYSIHSKLPLTISFFRDEIGVDTNSMGMLVIKCPYVFGYSIESRIRPTVLYLRSLGLANPHIVEIATRFPHVLCRPENALRPKVDYLRLTLGLNPSQVMSLIRGYPPILLASISNSLQPKLDFLVHTMGKSMEDVVQYPAFFAHSLSRSIRPRHRKFLIEDGIPCTLEKIFSLNHSKVLNVDFRDHPHGPTRQQLANLSLST